MTSLLQAFCRICFPVLMSLPIWMLCAKAETPIQQQEQPSFFLGAHAKGYITFHSLQAPVRSELVPWFEEQSFTGNNIAGAGGGISAMYQTETGWSLRAGVSYSSISTSLVWEEPPRSIPELPGGDTIIPSRSAYRYDINSSFLTADILAAVSLFESFPLGAVGGLSIDFPLEAKYKYTQNLLEPLDVSFDTVGSPYRFENFNRTMVISESSFSGIQVNLTGGLQYIFQLKKRGRDLGVAIVPSVLYSFPLKAFSAGNSTTEWKFSRLHMGVDLLFRL